MNDKKDGGTAFPIANLGTPNSLWGLSKRDYFATAAMQALVSISWDAPGPLARHAYKIADEMLKSREE